MPKKTGWLAGLVAALLLFLGLGPKAGASPAAPGNLALRAGVDSLIVTWTPGPLQGSPVDGYRVTIVRDGVTLFTQQPPGTATRYAWGIVGVAPGQTVTLGAAVEAHNAKGWGPPASGTASYTAGDLLPGAVTIQLQVKPAP